MTKSTITRERIQRIIRAIVSEAYDEEEIREWLSSDEIMELSRMALAAMDSEPVAVRIVEDGQMCPGGFGECDHSLPDGTHELYAAPQPAPVVDADDNFYSWFGREWAENYQHNQYTTAAKQMLGVMAESAWIAATERQRQKQSVSVPDVKIYEDVPYEVGRFKTHRDCYCDGWNACRAAMLQELKKSAGTEAICRSDENVQVLHTNSPAQSDCCPAQNSVSPAQGGNSPATSDNWQVEAEKLAEMHGMSFVMFRHGEAPQCADPTKVVISFTDKGLGHDTLPAAPQEVKGE